MNTLNNLLLQEKYDSLRQETRRYAPLICATNHNSYTEIGMWEATPENRYFIRLTFICSHFFHYMSDLKESFTAVDLKTSLEGSLRNYEVINLLYNKNSENDQNNMRAIFFFVNPIILAICTIFSVWLTYLKISMKSYKKKGCLYNGWIDSISAKKRKLLPKKKAIYIKRISFCVKERQRHSSLFCVRNGECLF